MYGLLYSMIDVEAKQEPNQVDNGCGYPVDEGIYILHINLQMGGEPHVSP